MVAGCGFLGSLGLGGRSADPPPASAAQIDAWVRQLGDADFQVRETATRELAQRPEAAAAVRRAAASADAEVARRATDILRLLERRTPLGRLTAAARGRECDLFVERAVRYEGSDQHVWDAILDLGADGCNVARGAFGRLKGFRSDQFPPRGRRGTGFMPLRGHPERNSEVEDASYTFRGGPLLVKKGGHAPLIAAAGSVEAASLGSTFCFATGPVTVTGGHVSLSVLVSDGDVTVRWGNEKDQSTIVTSVIVGRTNVTVSGRVIDSVVLAGGATCGWRTGPR